MSEKILTRKSDNIEISTHRGSWYVIDETICKGEPVFLLEHEEYGDEAASLIVDKHGNILVEDVFNGFDDLEYLEDD